MNYNPGELKHMQERGNVAAAMRASGRKSNDETANNSDTLSLEQTLYNIYETQLRVGAINMIKPQGTYPDNWKVNWTILETMIRQGFPIAVGQDGFGNIRILNSSNFSFNFGLNGMMGLAYAGGENGTGGIYDDLSKKLLKPITDLDPDNGDYVVFTNKNIASFLNFTDADGFNGTLNLIGMSDNELISATAMRLATNRATSFQNSLQMRSSTIFATRNKNVSGGNIVQKWLNGFPVIGVDDSFNVSDSITSLTGAPVIAEYMREARTEFDYLLGEYGMWLGLSSSGTLKESGVSDLEAASKMQQTESMAEIYLTARQDPLDKLCRRFGGDLKVMFNQQSAKLISNNLVTQTAQLAEQRMIAETEMNQIQETGVIPGQEEQ